MSNNQHHFRVKKQGRPRFIGAFLFALLLLPLFLFLLPVYAAPPLLTQIEVFEDKTRLSRIRGILFQPDGDLVFAVSKNSLFLWNPTDEDGDKSTDKLKKVDSIPVAGAKGQEPVVRTGTNELVGLAFDPDNFCIASGAKDGIPRQWTLDRDNPTSVFKAGGMDRWNDWVLAVAYHPLLAGYLAVGTSDNRVLVYSIEGPRIARIAEYRVSDTAQCLSFSPDGNTLAVGCLDGKIHIFDTKRLKAIDLPLSTPAKKIRETYLNKMVVVRPIVTPSEDNAAVMVKKPLVIAGSDAIYTKEIPSTVYGLTFISETEVAWAGKDGNIYIADVYTGVVKHILPGNAGRSGIYCIAYSPVTKRLVAGGADGRLYLWTPEMIAEDADPAIFPGDGAPIFHPDGVQCLAFDPTGEKLATGGREGNLILWKVSK